LALGKEASLPSVFSRHSAKYFFIFFLFLPPNFLWYVPTLLSAFRDRGVPKPTSECAACPSPDGSSAWASAKGGKERGGRSPARERWESRGLRVRPAPRSGALAVGGYKRPRG
jgi:hypothetical protein